MHERCQEPENPHSVKIFTKYCFSWLFLKKMAVLREEHSTKDVACNIYVAGLMLPKEIFSQPGNWL
jgi:hypothetical protein